MAALAFAQRGISLCQALLRAQLGQRVTMKLLLNLGDVKKSLPNLSGRLGDMIRTNSEALLGSIARRPDVNYSEGVSISSIYNHDPFTRFEPVRYPDGSSLMRLLAAPLIDLDTDIPTRILRLLWWILTHPRDFLKAQILPGWAHDATIVLVMQNKDNRMRFRIGRNLYTLFRKGLVAREEPEYEIHAQVEGSHAMLHSRRDEAMYQLKPLQGASASAWEDMIKGSDQAVKAMQEAFNRARTHFEKNK